MWLWASAAMMTATALLHSLFGERRLIVPLLATDSELIARPHTRRLIRFAWHATSLLMLTTALTIVWPGTPRAVVALVGSVWLIAGLGDGGRPGTLEMLKAGLNFRQRRGVERLDAQRDLPGR